MVSCIAFHKRSKAGLTRRATWKDSHGDDVDEYLRLQREANTKRTSLGFDQFLKLLEIDNKKIYEIANVNYKDITTNVSLLFWIADDEKAIRHTWTSSSV